MTTTTHSTKTEVSLDMILQFIKLYRDFEGITIEKANSIIAIITSSIEFKTHHVCSQWKWKKRKFGEFWLNLDEEVKILFLKYWQFNMPNADTYLCKINDDPVSAVFLKAPLLVRCCTNVLMFFENHGIDISTREKLDLPALPAPDRQYGDSSNWADFLLSFGPHMKQELNQVITTILNYYPKNRLTNQ